MTARHWIKGAIHYPNMVVRILWLRLLSAWLDIRIWRIERVNAKLRARLAALRTEIAIAKAKGSAL